MSAASTVVVSDSEHTRLATWTASDQPRLRLRARIVLRTAGGASTREVAAELGTTIATVRRWRSRFTADGVDGLRDRPRAGRPATRGAQAARSITKSWHHPAPTRSGRWSIRALARAAGVSPSTVSRVLPRVDHPATAGGSTGKQGHRPHRRADSDRPPWSRPRDPARVYYSGPRAMRALTHPARWAILHHLQVEGSGTASDCAPLVGLSVSATAYHLHQLARYGLLAGGSDRGDRRERVWRPLVPSLRMDDSTRENSETMHTVQQMIRASSAASHRRAQRWADAYPTESHQWRTASMFSYKALRTTPAELGTLYERIAALLQPYLANRRPSARTPATARLVHVDLQMFPREHPGGAAVGGSPPTAPRRR